MTIKTKYEIGEAVFALVEESDSPGFRLKQFKVTKIVIEESEEMESGYVVKANLEPIRGSFDVEVHDKDIFQTEEDFITSMKELWKNRK